MKGLLQSPARTSLLLSGLGLLGSKTQNQADKYFNLGAQGLLNHAQGVQDQKKLEEQRAYDQPLRDAKIASLNARANAAPNRQMTTGADGFKYFVDDGSRVLPNVTAPQQQGTSAQQDYALAQSQGFNGSFLDYQTALAEAKRTSITNNVGGQLPYKIPANMMLADPNDPSKGVVPIPGSPGGQLSGEGAKLEEISRGGLDAVTQLQEKMRSGDIDQGVLAAASVVPNMFQTTNVQQFETLRKDLTDMIGRLRSGGAITSDEEGRFTALVPAFGDKPETIEFKLKQLSDKFSNINTSVQLAPLPTETTGNETIEELLEIYK